MTPELHARAKAIFLQAIAVEGAARATLVDEACGSDESLRGEVLTLLAHHRSRTILPTAPHAAPRHVDTAEVSPTVTVAAPLVARRIGRAAAAVSGLIFSQLLGGSRGKVLAVVAGALFVGLGLLVSRLIHRAMQTKLHAELTTLLAAEVEAVRIWMASQQSTAVAIAGDPDVRRLSLRLAEIGSAGESAGTAILTSAELRQLREQLQPLLDAHGYQGFVLLDAQRRVVAATEDGLIGDARLARGLAEMEAVFSTSPRALVVPPFASLTSLLDVDGRYRAGVPTMFAIAPIRDGTGRVVAGLGLRIPPERDFTRILGVARGGTSGETYAFDRRARLLSESRFDEELKELGLLPDRPEARSILAVELRDPGVDLTRGQRPAQRPSERPVTRPVAAALAGQSGVDVDGYRDYRGVPSVGAWAWLDDYGFGVITEIDADEAFAPLHYLRLIFAGLLVLLACAGAAALGSSFFVVRLRREVQQAQQVGQYTLERLIGEGGMGQVYLARHALLRRPTAVKLLKPGPHSRQAVARFEREVQLASRLTHPNTIDIYDFGQTPEGDLYYAMEYLPGVTLDQLLRSDGAVPPGRAVHIMRQVCRSLQEAHGIGLIHRDIKPQNIMLCERGGEYDFVKVLDFGLVKQVAQSDVPPITTDVQVRGTPMYLAPEAVTDPQHVDARADIYAVGVVLYNLLTNRPPWEANNLAMLFHLLATRDPPRPAQTSQIPIPQTLDDLVVACLARDPSQRPQTIQEILAVLDSDLGLAPWTQEQARQWWRQRPATPDTTPLNRSIHASA